ncbi:hypothetical protein VNO78_32460 [Psophocarpus tetragonolobus]|uniref:Uncharacterized protein n=1 Tax=Psophocarpus tetragonolobus TaxID=3891 RepID=A0AAN9P2R0_PSOTE
MERVEKKGLQMKEDSKVPAISASLHVTPAMQYEMGDCDSDCKMLVWIVILFCVWSCGPLYHSGPGDGDLLRSILHSTPNID